MAIPEHILADVRAELADLIALVDTATRPEPTRTNPADHPMPGPQWDIASPTEVGRRREMDRWIVRAVTDPEASDCVYVSTPDYSDVEDMRPVAVADARRVAMALLAAADYADERRAGVTRLDERRAAGGA
ncbi:hypothetical protein [Marinactinospora rubrisoli]|uniref:Uncharacterized protein n=1 Tax=Marinactinospora rubrisoli TaxID=2715399 RepID=A0ABW2KLA2_9ACTN